MKFPCAFRLAGLAVVSSLPLAVFALAGETLSLEQAHEIRKDVQAASEAVGQIGQSDAQSDIKNIEVAKGALGRVNERLDAYIADQMKAAGPVDPYGNGKKYPPLAGVALESFSVPVGATEVHVPVTMDRPSPNTVIAFVRVYNGDGGRATPDTTKAVIFRPGDPLKKSVSFAVSGMSAGNTLKALQSSVADGGLRKGNGITITAVEGAVNVPIADGGRAPLKFVPFGQPTYAAAGNTIQFDDKGGPGSFSTSLSHGRTQVGNGETGYYGPVDMGGFVPTPDGLALSSRRLDKPVPVGSPAINYPFLAVMLSGHRTPETQFKYGSVEWEVKMPNRKGSWPALWLLPTAGWPPEIDVYEGFGYNGSWNFAASLSTNLHGGDKNQRTFTRPAMNMRMSTFGLANTLDSEFHRFAVTVDGEWITMFIDDVETMRYANPFKGETWYPLTNVAVKANIDSPYADGSGDLVLRSLKVWRAE